MKEISEMKELEEPRYTYDQISELFGNSNQNVDFKNHVLAYFNGMAQGMYNVSVGRTLLKVEQPDMWEEGYLKVKSLYDIYEKCK